MGNNEQKQNENIVLEEKQESKFTFWKIVLIILLLILIFTWTFFTLCWGFYTIFSLLWKVRELWWAYAISIPFIIVWFIFAYLWNSIIFRKYIFTRKQRLILIFINIIIFLIIFIPMFLDYIR